MFADRGDLMKPRLHLRSRPHPARASNRRRAPRSDRAPRSRDPGAGAKRCVLPTSCLPLPLVAMSCSAAVDLVRGGGRPTSPQRVGSIAGYGATRAGVSDQPLLRVRLAPRHFAASEVIVGPARHGPVGCGVESDELVRASARRAAWPVRSAIATRLLHAVIVFLRYLIATK